MQPPGWYNEHGRAREQRMRGVPISHCRGQTCAARQSRPAQRCHRHVHQLFLFLPACLVRACRAHARVQANEYVNRTGRGSTSAEKHAEGSTDLYFAARIEP